MTRLRVLLRRLLATFGGHRREDELRDEIDLHLDLLAEEYRRRGLSDRDAHEAARRSFGGVMQVREVYRAQRRLPAIDELLQDVRFASRTLLRERASTLAAIGLLAIGVAATVVMADALDRLLLRPPPHVRDPQRVVRLYTASQRGHASVLTTNYPTVEHLFRAVADDVEAFAAFQNETLGLGRGPDARALAVVSHTESYFDVLGLTPSLGTLPSAQLATPPDVAVISHRFWRQQFGRSPDVLGKPLHVGRRIYTIAAVAPKGFVGIDDEPVDVWLPLASRAADGALQPDWRTSAFYAAVRVIARVRPGSDRERVAAHASAAYNAFRAGLGSLLSEEPVRIVFGELPAARVPGGEPASHAVQGIGIVSVLVLLIACGNVGNLLLVRGFRRGRELALKTTLGATRARLLREILVEAALLAFAAGGLGLMAVLTAGTLVRRLLLPPVLAVDAPLDSRLILFTVAVTLSATFLMGMAPALRLTSRRVLAPARDLRPAGSSRVLDTFAAMQVALSVPLIIGAALFSLSLWKARQVNFGFDASNVVVLWTDLEAVGESDATHEVHRRIEQQLRQLPQVTGSALVATIPLRWFIAKPITVPGFTWEGFRQATFVNAVDPSYFGVMDIRFVAGRSFEPEENVARGRRVAIVNETFARTYWPVGSALGKCVQVHGGGAEGEHPCTEIVGVVANPVPFPAYDMLNRASEMAYLPIEQEPELTPQRAVLVRTARAPQRVLDLLRTEAQATVPNLPYVNAWALEDAFQPALKPLRLGATVFAGFGVLALLITGVGLAAVTAYSVTRRTRELGIRLVLGANPRTLVAQTLLRSLGAAAMGLAVGCAVASVGSRWMQSVLFGVDGGDIRIYAASAAILLLVSLASAYIPARRAARVEPAVTLRAE